MLPDDLLKITILTLLDEMELHLHAECAPGAPRYGYEVHTHYTMQRVLTS